MIKGEKWLNIKEMWIRGERWWINGKERKYDMNRIKMKMIGKRKGKKKGNYEKWEYELREIKEMWNEINKNEDNII